MNTAQIRTDESQFPGPGASANRNTINFLGGKRDLVLGILLAIGIIEGAALFYEWRNKQVAEDMHGYDARQAQVKLEVDEQLLTILNCKR